MRPSLIPMVPRYLSVGVTIVVFAISVSNTTIYTPSREQRVGRYRVLTHSEKTELQMLSVILQD
jgi:hypothetical protein